MVLSINLLFKVTDFRIENTDRTTPANTGIYTEEQILDLLGVQVGDNLFGFSTSQKSRELQAQLPYRGAGGHPDARHRGGQGAARPTERFAIQTAAGWLVLSDGLKVLRSDSAQPEGLIQLQVNLDPRLSQTPGSYLSLLDSADAVIAATAETATAETATDEDAAASRADTALDQLVQQLEDTGLLDGVTLISLQDMEEINFLYQGRVSVVLGTANNLPYKLQIASRIVLDTDGTGLASTDRGTLDVSYQRSDGSIVGYSRRPRPPLPTQRRAMTARTHPARTSATPAQTAPAPARRTARPAEPPLHQTKKDTARFLRQMPGKRAVFCGFVWASARNGAACPYGAFFSR